MKKLFFVATLTIVLGACGKSAGRKVTCNVEVKNNSEKTIKEWSVNGGLGESG
jgi:hypothetical protein